MKDYVILALAFVLVILCLLAMALGSSAIECNARTADIGFPSKWGIFSGCRINIDGNRWIPLSSYYWKDEQ